MNGLDLLVADKRSDATPTTWRVSPGSGYFISSTSSKELLLQKWVKQHEVKHFEKLLGELSGGSAGQQLSPGSAVSGFSPIKKS